jgi:hypothetical protein
VDTAPTGATVGGIGIGVAAFRTGDLGRAVGLHIAWTKPSGLTWLFIAACAVAAWVIGYGLGYRRGIKDAMSGINPSAEQRINGN